MDNYTSLRRAVEVEGDLTVAVKVYNIEVADWHTYLVGKWLWVVHNSKVCLADVLKVYTAPLKPDHFIE